MADYPISNVPRRVQYVNSGVGPYAFTFAVLVQTDIAVYRGNTLLTLTTDYSVVINANGTGSITLVTAGTGNITIVGARAIQRTSDYTTGGDLFASTLNVDLDSQTIFSQQLAENIGRTVAVPITDASTLDMQLPVSSARANKVFGFTNSGQPTVSNTTLTQLDAAVSSFVNTTGNNASSIIYTPTGSGAVATTVQAKLRETVSVKDFGAVGDGVADDTVAIQAALDTGRAIYFPNGTYLTGSINAQSNTVIYGESKTGVIIQPIPSVPSNVLVGFGGKTDVEIYNLTFPNTLVSHPALVPINLSSSTKIYIHDINFGTSSSALQLYSSTNCVIEDVIIGRCSTYGIYSDYGVNNKFNRCSVAGTDLFHCIQDNHGFQNLITGCKVSNGYQFGISIYNSEQITVTNNICSETRLEGINLQNSNSCIVSNNTCFWSAGVSLDFGISLWGPVPSENTNFNIITGNRVLGCGKSGIVFADQCQFNTISNNIITNVNDIDESFGAGILSYGTGGGNNTISNNIVWSNNGKLYYGINASGDFANIITNNFLSTFITAPILDVDGSGSIQALNATNYTAYTPVVTPSSGAITSYTASGGWYQVNSIVYFSVSVSITDNGTGSGVLRISIPFTSSSYAGTGCGRNTTTGASCIGLMGPSATFIEVYTTANAYPVATGSSLYISGFYERV
jgi:parallel beta-helix repeat protein